MVIGTAKPRSTSKSKLRKPSKVEPDTETTNAPVEGTSNKVTTEAEKPVEEKKEEKEEKKSLLPYHPKPGDKIVLISPMMQTCIAEFYDEDNQYYVLKNPLLFASFPERDKENPNMVRTVLQAPAIWNRIVMADQNQDQYVIFPKSTYGIMFIDDNTNAAMFSTDVSRMYGSAWGKVERK